LRPRGEDDVFVSNRKEMTMTSLPLWRLFAGISGKI